MEAQEEERDEDLHALCMIPSTVLQSTLTEVPHLGDKDEGFDALHFRKNGA